MIPELTRMASDLSVYVTVLPAFQVMGGVGHDGL